MDTGRRGTTKQRKPQGDDVAAVLGIKSTDNVLFVGGLPWLEVKSVAGWVGSVSSPAELGRSPLKYERVIVSGPADPELVRAALGANCGLLAVFSRYPQERAALAEQFSHFHQANVWEFKTSAGSCVVTDARL